MNNRRRFLKASGLALGAGAFALGAGVWAVQPRRQSLPLPDGNDDRPAQLAGRRKRVVVVGGGLAGLTAATELAARHFEVTLVERAAQLGGKLTAWNVRALGEDFPVEHGFHGFFAQYYNLRRLLAQAGVEADLVPSPGYPVLFADRPPETFGRTTRLFPFNMLSVVRQSRALKMRDFMRDSDGLHELMRYDGDKTFARWDGVDFARFAVESQINRPMVETVLEPFGKTTLNRIARLSAAEAIRFFHFYFMGNPEGLGFHYLRRDSMTAVVGPLRQRLEALGGKVRLGLGARRLELAGGKVARVVIDAQPALPPRVVMPTPALSEKWHALPTSDGGGVFVRQRGEALEALDGRCTHMGCPVTLADDGGFHCPCHGGRFDGDGRAVAGPPRSPLARLPVWSFGEMLAVGGGPTGAPEEALDCDWLVLACDTRGLRELVERSEGLGGLGRGVAALAEADPYVVWRLWLDKPVAAGRAPFYTTARFRYTDSLAIYSAFQEPFVSWARRTGGSVVEVHAYAIAPEALAPAAEMRAQMWKELVQLLPELSGARVLHEERQQQANFTRWAPGDWATRPATDTPVPNVKLAGDHVKLPAPAALMEAAVMSGVLAANAIAGGEGLKESPVPTVALRGPLA